VIRKVRLPWEKKTACVVRNIRNNLKHQMGVEKNRYMFSKKKRNAIRTRAVEQKGKSYWSSRTSRRSKKKLDGCRDSKKSLEKPGKQNRPKRTLVGRIKMRTS